MTAYSTFRRPAIESDNMPTAKHASAQPAGSGTGTMVTVLPLVVLNESVAAVIVDAAVTPGTLSTKSTDSPQNGSCELLPAIDPPALSYWPETLLGGPIMPCSFCPGVRMRSRSNWLPEVNNPQSTRLIGPLSLNVPSSFTVRSIPVVDVIVPEFCPVLR